MDFSQYELEDSIPLYNNTTHSVPRKDTGIRFVVGLVCTLSIIGALLIILSYICFKSRRTKPREILVHISLMDLGVGLANIIGLVVYFDQYYFYKPPPGYIDGLCRAQAFFAGYATLGSIFWTISLMTYLYFRIHSQTKLARNFLYFCYVFCYGFPLPIGLWLVLTKRLGYSPYDSAGWCSLITKDPLTGEVDIFVTVFANDLWIYLATFLIPILYISVRIFISNKVKATKQYAAENQLWSALHNVDYKFLFIPVIFVSLRIWTCINNLILFAGVMPDENNWIFKVLYYLSGIGDSGQGFANAILFVIFSKNVRDSFKKCIQCNQTSPVQEHHHIHIESSMVDRSAGSDHEATTTDSESEGNEQSSHFSKYGALN